ncbi:hypothetical protein BH11PSE3_BH11PSE3_41310 [soil metagenome]
MSVESKTPLLDRVRQPADLRNFSIERLARQPAVLLTIEEGAAGALGSLVMQHRAWRGLLDSGPRFRAMALPDRLPDYDSQPRQHDEAGLVTPRIVPALLSAMGQQGGLRTPSLARTS